MTLQAMYDTMRQGTVAMPGFALATVLLLLAVAGRSRPMRSAGLAVLGLATAVLAAGFGIRWALSGHAWYLPPMFNQFEAVYASALLAAVLALALDLLARQSVFAAAAAVYATLATLACFMFRDRMGADISAPAGILNSPILALHVSTIVLGHGLVGMTFVISLAYLAVLAITRPAQRGLPTSTGADLATAPADLAGILPARSILVTLDRCNLLVAQLATLLVIVGTILGAYWGDAAWGRWWGWDIKETWALVTCVIYVMILHARFISTPQRRGLVTAALCILGGAAMAFNWVAVNYFFTGMHSYAGQ